jgi:hypothetical protein
LRYHTGAANGSHSIVFRQQRPHYLGEQYAMDETAFPRVTRYLRSLPRGLLSFPEAECKASVYRDALAHLPKKMPTHGLDPLLVDYFENPMPVSAWVPEVVNSALFLAMADAFFPGEVGFLNWISHFAEATFRSPMYRVLMVVASPRALAQGGSRRWAAFHTGTEYETRVGDNGAETTLRFPPYAFDSLVVKGTLRAIQAAYRATGAREATVDLIDWSPTKAQYRSVWYPSRSLHV